MNNSQANTFKCPTALIMKRESMLNRLFFINYFKAVMLSAGKNMVIWELANITGEHENGPAFPNASWPKA